MTTVADIKKFVLQVLVTFGGKPLPEGEIVRVVNNGFTQKPLQSDIKDALRELERDEFIQGAPDDLDANVTTWTLTPKGTHKAKQLNR
jgi:hypothetical protein